jgi:hypothetical protein
MTRKPSDAARLAALDTALRDMLQAFSAQPIPSRLMSVLDQLDDSEPHDRRKATLTLR